MRRVLNLTILLGLLVVADRVAAQSPATSAISHEPLYAGLIRRAQTLKAETDGFAPSVSLLSRSEFKAYSQAIRALSDADMQGHLDLKARGTDRDLKCILMGVSLDLKIKLDALAAADSDAAMRTALDNMSQLLSDNVDVVATPATAESGLDCVIEFGSR